MKPHESIEVIKLTQRYTVRDDRGLRILKRTIVFDPVNRVVVSPKRLKDKGHLLGIFAPVRITMN